MRREWRLAALFVGALVYLYYRLGRQPDVRGLRVAVIEQTNSHSEVLSAVVSTLSSIGADTNVYSNYAPRGLPVLQPVEFAAPAIEQGNYDAVVLTSCDAQFWETGQEALLSVLRTSTARVVCVAHWPDSWAAMERARLGQFGDRLRLVTLAPHVATALDVATSKWNPRPRPAASFVPIYTPTGHLLDRAKPRARRAAIVGRVSRGRDLAGIQAALAAAIKASPRTWGYEMQDGELVPGDEAFELHFIGFETAVIPRPPGVVVKIHTPRVGSETYRLIHDMDVLLPAFSDDLYYTLRAAETVPAAIMAKTPILASPRLVLAYPYLAPPAALSTPDEDPDSVVEALRALQTGMPRNSHKKKVWDKYTDILKKDNERVWRHLLVG